jgi:hypothetical protein
VAKLRPIQRRPADPEPREIDVMSVGGLEWFSRGRCRPGVGAVG